jgi:hypothetical protein
VLPPRTRGIHLCRHDAPTLTLPRPTLPLAYRGRKCQCDGPTRTPPEYRGEGNISAQGARTGRHSCGCEGLVVDGRLAADMIGGFCR